MTTPLHKNPCPAGHEVYNCGRPFIGHQDYTLRCIGHAPEQRRRFFKEIYQFYNFYPKITSHWGGVGGHEIYNFWSPSPIYATYQICKDWHSSLEEKMLTDDDGRQPIGIDHLVDSGDLIQTLHKSFFNARHQVKAIYHQDHKQLEQ